MTPEIKTIGLDADDTLWHNENIFEDHHKIYCEILADYHDSKTIEETLYETEMKNLELYGYGIKSFTLSCIETAIGLTNGKIQVEEIQRIIDRCKQMLDHPVELLDHVEDTVAEISKNHELILITKGDLRDQERKIYRSGLAQYFDGIEVVSDKTEESYSRVLRRHNVAAKNFLMVGNSLKSDVMPVLKLGGYGVHIPYHTTWQHERVDSPPPNNQFFNTLKSIKDLGDTINNLSR